MGDGITNVATPTLVGTGTVGDTITLYDTDGTTVLGTAVVDGSGNWSVASSALVDGVHSVTVKQTNAAGTTGAASKSVSLTIDSTLPTATISLGNSALKVGDTSSVTISLVKR